MAWHIDDRNEDENNTRMNNEEKEKIDRNINNDDEGEYLEMINRNWQDARQKSYWIACFAKRSQFLCGLLCWHPLTGGYFDTSSHTREALTYYQGTKKSVNL